MVLAPGFFASGVRRWHTLAMPLPVRPPMLDDDIYQQGALRRAEDRLTTAAATRPAEMAKLGERNRKGQRLATMYSDWAKEQTKSQRERDLTDVDRAIEGYAKSDSAKDDAAPPKVSGADWLAQLGIKSPERNPMLGQAPRGDIGPRYGYDARGPDTTPEVIDDRARSSLLQRLLPQQTQTGFAPAPPPIQAPVPERYTASGQAARENALTPAMLQALGRGNVTGAPQVESEPAMAYDLMAGDEQAERNRRMRGVG